MKYKSSLCKQQYDYINQDTDYKRRKEKKKKREKKRLDLEKLNTLPTT